MFDRFRRLFGHSMPPTDTPAADAIAGIDRADIADQIGGLADGGFETRASAVEAITESYLGGDAISSAEQGWIEAEIGRAFARKRQAEATWPPVTDYDRLDAAFAVLNDAGIIALHNAGYTMSDGFSDAGEVLYGIEQAGGSARGCTFYHGQDVEAVVRGGGLYLAFDSFDDSEDTALAIAREIVAAVAAQGLAVTWDGTIRQRILLPSIDWRKRSPEES